VARFDMRIIPAILQSEVITAGFGKLAAIRSIKKGRAKKTLPTVL
jgi:hypothetical protein